MQTDPISDLLTRIRNAARAKHARVDVPASKLKTEIARILKEEGYISTFKLVDESKVRKTLRVFLKYTPDKRSAISDVAPAAGLRDAAQAGGRAALVRCVLQEDAKGLAHLALIYQLKGGDVAFLL